MASQILFLTKPGLMPLPNAAGGSLIQTYAQPQDNDQGLIRVDYNLGAKHMLTGRYNHNYATQISYRGQRAQLRDDLQLGARPKRHHVGHLHRDAVHGKRIPACL